ncbi:hypothetical protein PCK2_000503 [Pneumocystis canis]|nr:hypothetical protein PCK2_000503 [Pneumocystis canis]
MFYTMRLLRSSNFTNGHVSFLGSLADNSLSFKKAKRVGRGPSSGRGKTCGRGHKGQKARGGNNGVKVGFEGGQTPLTRLYPKRGFSNSNSKEFAPLNLLRLQIWINNGRINAAEPITMKHLYDSNIIHGIKSGIKLLADVITCIFSLWMHFVINIDIVQEKTNIYLPSSRSLKENEILEPDQSAYEMLHSITVQWPCLSFDILEDNLGAERTSYPATVYLVSGSQADTKKNNVITIIKLSQLYKTQYDDDSSIDSCNSNIDEDPILEYRSLSTFGTTNCIRAFPKNENYFVASFSETGKVHIWDIASHISSINNPGSCITKENNYPIYTILNHKIEGYAINWNTLTSHNFLISGDNNGCIYLTSLSETSWFTEKEPFLGHTSSVEDLKWSPSEKNVFASASSDGTIKIWDIRNKKHKPALNVDIHPGVDINVISWNKNVSYLMATGADDGKFNIWDLRTFQSVVIKVGMIGDSQIGKTSLMVKYVEGSFDEDYIQTLGVNFMEKTISIRNTEITFSIWDLGGQREFVNMLPLVCNDAVAILFMFDLTRKSTLNSIKEWYRQARGFNKVKLVFILCYTYFPKTAIPFLVGTKYDHFANFPKEDQEEITKQSRRFARAMKASLIFCSTSHSINVQKIFKIVLSKAFDLKCTIPEIINIGEPILEYTNV